MDFDKKYQLNDFAGVIFAGEDFADERNITQYRYTFFLQSITKYLKSNKDF